jgi:hypothetical protein
VYPEHLTRTSTRLSRRSAGDLSILRRATRRIEEQSAALDRRLMGEHRVQERLRLLRQATGQITRDANDGIQAYRRMTAALREERQRAGTDPVEAAAAARTLADARASMLEALDAASRKYPWAKPWRSPPD